MIGASTSGAPASGATKAEHLSSSDEQFKGATGLRRLVNACRYSMAGLRHALAREAAIRQELLACIVLIPVALLLPVPAIERLLLVLSMLLVLLTEFINSAIEAAIDRISLDRHPLSARPRTWAAPPSPWPC